MSHSVRGPGRGGKPNQGYFAEQHGGAIPPDSQKFVMPLVSGQMPGYHRITPVQMQPQQGYPNQFVPQPQYGQQPAYFPQQQQPVQQPPPHHQQQSYNSFRDYHQHPQYMYQNPQMFADTMSFPPPQPPQQPQQTVQPPPQEQKRRKVILEIVDPTTKKAVEIGSTPAAASVPPPAQVAPEVAEKKEQFSREFMDKVKKELNESQRAKSPNSGQPAAPQLPVNFSVPPPNFATPGSVAPFVPSSVAAQEKIQNNPVPPAKIESPDPVESESEPAQAEPTTPPAALNVQVKCSPAETATSGTSESVSVAPEAPTLKKEDSKEDTEDDKFDETPSQCEESSATPEAAEAYEKSPEELAQENAQKEAEAEEKRKQREKQLDERIEQSFSTGEAEISKGLYGRDFMATVREYEKLFHRTPCPLSPQQLAEFGLDIKSMRVADKSKPNFTPNWVPNNKGNRQQHPYRGRTTTDGTGRGAQPRDRGNHKRPPVVRPSIERVQRVTLPSSKDAWKPDRQKTSTNLADDEASVKEVCKKVRSLMNKITPTSQKPLTQELISYNVSSNDAQLREVVDIVFDKAVEEPKFCSLYAELCKSQVDHELIHGGQKSAFRNTVLTRTQLTFQDKKDYNEERMAVIAKEEDAEKRKLLEMEERLKFRRRKFGVMTFIGYLYRNQLLSTKIVHACVFDLLTSILPKKIGEKEQEMKNEDIDEESVHCALQLSETVGMMLDKSNSTFLDQWIQKLNFAKPFCSNKIRFMIMNLIELRNNKWVPRKSVETGPKKIDEIHKDILQEKMENEKARDQYDRDRDRRGIRTNSNSLRKNAPVSRNSLERNKGFQHPEQKRAAAAATTKLTSSSVQPKNISLSSMNDASLGKSKKEWQSGASGGGNATSEAPKSVWIRRDSNDQRKKSTVDEKQSAISAAKEISAMSLSGRRSTSQNSIPGEELEMIKAKRAKLINVFSSDIKEVESGDLPQKEMANSFKDYVGNDRYASPSLSGVYEMVVRLVAEEAFNESKRRLLAHVIRFSLTGKAEKNEFIEGVVNFCKYAVDIEMWQDLPQLWNFIGDVLVNVSHVPHEIIKDEKLEHLTLSDMVPIFLAAKMDGSKKFSLLVNVLKGLAEIEMAEEGGNTCGHVAWDFQELNLKEQMEKEGLKEELNNVTTSCGATLLKLLTS
uniref:MIF4G domain-containing protein n=1 Tax=Caenorhabditis japonica TaxID=281687 RepID=A0A8R1DYC2_CAEJA